MRGTVCCIEGSFRDGGYITCAGCAGNDEGVGGSGEGAGVGPEGIERATRNRVSVADCIKERDDEGVEDGIGVEVGDEDVVAVSGVSGAAEDEASLSSEGIEISSGVVGTGDSGETTRGRRGTLEACCE